MAKIIRSLKNIGFTCFGAFCLVQCGHNQAPTTALFNGECRVEVKSKVSDSEILMDGIPVGHDEVLLQVPCGERLVEVHKKGYVPFHEYYKVDTATPLNLIVDLSPRQKLANEALSMALVEKVRGPKMAAAAAETQKSSSGESAPAAGDSAPAGQPKWDSVDDWR